MAHVPQSLVPVTHGDLLLRAATQADVAKLVVAFDDPLIKRWNPAPAENGAENAARDWVEQRNDWSSGDHVSWVVSTPAGALVGSVSLHHIDIEQANAEVGYWVGPEFRGRGLAGRAVDLAARFAFETLGFRRVYLYHSVENPASCRAAGRAGFALEGTLRESYRYGDGRFHDEHLHGRLATDASRVNLGA